MNIFFKVFIEFATILFLFFMFCFLAVRHTAPRPGIEPALLALEGEGLTTRKSPNTHTLNLYLLDQDNRIHLN